MGQKEKEIAAVLHCIVKLQAFFLLRFCPHSPTPIHLGDEQNENVKT